jgi:hypothetical protein
MINMKMTMLQKDVKAIERGIEKHNTDAKGFLHIVEGWVKDNKKDEGTPQYEALLYFRDCVKTYVGWGM